MAVRKSAKSVEAEEPEFEETNRSGRKVTPKRLWSITQSAIEFGVDRAQLSRRLAQQSIEPNADGRYTTVQIAQAIYGDYHAERNRKMREDADSAMLENAKRRGELIDKTLVFRFCSGIAVNIRQKILGSPTIPESDKEDILHELKDLFDERIITQHTESL